MWARSRGLPWDCCRSAHREEVAQVLVVTGDELSLDDELGLKRRERAALDGGRVVGEAAQEVALVGIECVVLRVA